MSTVESSVVRRVNEIEARRAVAGVDADLMEKSGLSPIEADAISVALRRYLIGDTDGARKELTAVFVDKETVEQMLAEFGTMADAA